MTLSILKRNIIIGTLVLTGILAACGLAEVYLRHRADRISNSNRLEPGLVRYDPDLGWRLNAGWRGSHAHADFSVTYSINTHGFRGDSHATKKGCKQIYGVVGDSFSFGIGVNDGQTFTDQLNRMSPGNCFLNFSVPGYSTDQEYLLIREAVVPFAPSAVLLIVYLGNDIYDNARAYPLQSAHAKPFFEIGPEKRLRKRNTPVPRQSKPAEQFRRDLMFFLIATLTGSRGRLPGRRGIRCWSGPWGWGSRRSD